MTACVGRPFNGISAAVPEPDLTPVVRRVSIPGWEGGGGGAAAAERDRGRAPTNSPASISPTAGLPRGGAIRPRDSITR